MPGPIATAMIGIHGRKGSRWLMRYEKEVELFANLTYFGLTTGRGASTISLILYLTNASQPFRPLEKNTRVSGPTHLVSNFAAFISHYFYFPPSRLIYMLV